MVSNDILNLKYSPVLVSEILYNYCMGAKRVDDRGSKFELIYLVLPIVMDVKFRSKLQSMKITSTFKTAFLNKNEELKERLFLINDKAKYSRNVTNDGLIYLNSVCLVEVGEYFNVHSDYERKEHVDNLTCSLIGSESPSGFELECFKAAFNLGSIFAKEGYVNVFLKTKVNKI